ncbi:MFS transporter [Actinorhabdospora filicis]|uniref:MFS transporter n=1 Tax=Actinorhabdospora filicis TaxID=1785913 RepID=A0A9W6SL77_9ACTN|nr:MFS transporter [Actinorhabdospora filicis]GLZ76646.1 MFS transporter [Actinorhabdospora filicis]
MSALAPPQTTARTGRALAVAAAAPLLALSIYTVPLVNTADTAKALGAGVTAQTWIMNGSPFGLAAVLLVTGSLADAIGRRRLFTWGAVALAAASLLGALAPNAGVLIAARTAQGMAGAALISASLGIVGHLFTDPAARGKATGQWAAALGAGLTVGPLLAGGLTALDWSAVYWLDAVAAVGLAVATRALPESRSETRRRMDPAGMTLLALALVALLSAVTLGREGWTRPAVPVLFAAALVLAVAFVLVERRHASPAVDLRLFRQPLFLLSTLGALVNGVVIIGVNSTLALVWQHTHGFSAWYTALTFTAWAGASLLAALNARRIGLRPTRLLALGFLIAATIAGIIGTAAHWSLWRVLVVFVVSGVGAGLTNAALARLAIDSVPPQQVSMGSGANNTARYIGSSVGVAASIAVLSAKGWAGGLDLLLVLAAALLVVAAVVTALVRTSARS